MDEIKSTLKEYLEIAPQNILAVIKKISDKPEIVAEIARRQNLDESMFEALQIEIFLILLGVEPFSTFRANLVQELDLTYDQALKISMDANISIFGPVMETLRNMERGIIDEKGPATEETKTRPSSGEAENILHSQMDKGAPANLPTSNTAVKPSAPQATPLLMDHEEMERVDGIHLHSQSIMPSASSMSMRAVPKPASTQNISRPIPQQTPKTSPQSAPATPVAPKSPGIFRHSDPALPKSSFRSIVDEKLSGLVRSNNTPAQGTPSGTNSGAKPQPEKSKPYSGNDPYREPLQ